jgi:transposase
MVARTKYSTDLTDAEWQLIERMVPEPKPGGRPAKYTRRDVVDAVRYVVRSGCPWRLLPHDFPRWNSVFKYFTDWKKAGVWKRIHDKLRGDVREAEGRDRFPSAGIVDSQSVKTTERGASRLRRGQENLWSQETPFGRHARTGSRSRGASSQRAGS